MNLAHWVCPSCEHGQTEGVDPDHGPFMNVICENCASIFDICDLPLRDRESLWGAIAEAENENEKA